MSSLPAFLLPPAVALIGMRLLSLLLGKNFPTGFGFGLRFAAGLATGMLVFTQAIVFGAMVGLNLAGPLGKLALLGGLIELILLLRQSPAALKQLEFEPAHLWLLLLLPAGYYFIVFGQLSVLEGTMEFDANAHWVFKAKVLYLKQGQDLMPWLHSSRLAYAHWDYPLLVSALYTLDYGAVGGVNEFVNKVWPFWQVVALCGAILSLGNCWRRPQPLPIALASLFCFLPATIQYIRWEGGTMPMVFYISLAALLIVQALAKADVLALAVALPVLAGCGMTKFEGVIYAVFWGLALLPFGWKNKWFQSRLIWKAGALVVISLVPYVMFRLAKPMSHVDNLWSQTVIHSPGTVAQYSPMIFLLSLGGRFFNQEFFNWGVDAAGKVVWNGHWTGLSSLVNEQLNIAPWLLLLLLGLSLWKGRQRPAVLWLSLVMICVMGVLAIILTSLPEVQGDLPRMLSLTGEGAGRYYYPYGMAWLLAVASLWFQAPAAATTSDKPAPKKK